MSNVNTKMICRCTCLLAVILEAGTSGVLAATSAEILEKAHLRGGIACVIGAEQVDTALGLAKEGGFVVHLLDSDAAKVADARNRLAVTGWLGRQVYVDALTGGKLPYADNLVDLLVATGTLVTEAEVFRVLAPVRGKALLGEEVVARPALAGADDWTHRLHGGDNNPVANDTAFQMPAMLQYLGMPMQTSFQGAMLVEGGRRIELSDWVAKKPDRSARSGKLLARSLCSGQVLWERELPHEIEPDTPICALDNGRVYLASGDAPRVLVIDAETGRDLPAIDLAGEPNLRVKWLAIEGGRLYALLGQVLPVRVPLSFPISREVRLKQTESGRTIVAWELKSERKLWSHVEDATVDYHTIAVRNGRTYFYSEQTRLACLDSQGKQLWENRDSSWKGELKRGPLRNANTEAVSTLRVGPGQVWLSVPGITSGLMFSAENGKLLWQGRVANTDFFTGDRFYTVGGRANPETGEIVEQGHFSIGGWCGIRTWVPALKSGLGHVAFGMRSPCGVGIYAAGGVVCVMPSQCDCWPSVRGAGGLVSAGNILQQVKQSPQHPLETGPATVGQLHPAPGDWPQYRGDIRRTGAATILAGGSARLRWLAKSYQPFPVPEGHDVHRLEWLDRPTPPVTAGGMALVGASDGSVRASRIADGTPAWTFWTGGPVLTSPAIAGGRVYVGSGDGWLYCLDAATGQLAWRWRGAPAERRIMVYGKLMSSWPVTALLVHGGTVHGVAGQWMLNGTATFALDAATGREHWVHWTDPDNNHFIDPYLKREDPAFAPAGQLAIVGRHLWIRDYLGVPAIFETGTGRRVPVTEDLVKFQKTYWNFGVWFATAGQDILVVNDRLVLQGGYPLLGNPDIRHDKSGARFVALRLNDQGQIQALPHPPTAIPNSQIAPALADDELLIVGGGPTKTQPTATTGLSLWTLVAWQDQFSTLVSGGDEPAADEGRPGAAGRAKTQSDDPFHKRPPARRQLEMQQARWCIADADLNAVVLCPDAAVVAAGVPKPADKSRRGIHPGFASWQLAAIDRVTGAKRWSVALPCEPVFNGVAPAADGSWIVVLRDGSVACVGK